jgi:hypothetical protein
LLARLRAMSRARCGRSARLPASHTSRVPRDRANRHSWRRQWRNQPGLLASSRAPSVRRTRLLSSTTGHPRKSGSQRHRLRRQRVRSLVERGPPAPATRWPGPLALNEQPNNLSRHRRPLPPDSKTFLSLVPCSHCSNELFATHQDGRRRAPAIRHAISKMTYPQRYTCG